MFVSTVAPCRRRCSTRAHSARRHRLVRAPRKCRRRSRSRCAHSFVRRADAAVVASRGAPTRNDRARRADAERRTTRRPRHRQRQLPDAGAHAGAAHGAIAAARRLDAHRCSTLVCVFWFSDSIEFVIVGVKARLDGTASIGAAVVDERSLCCRSDDDHDDGDDGDDVCQRRLRGARRTSSTVAIVRRIDLSRLRLRFFEHRSIELTRRNAAPLDPTTRVLLARCVDVCVVARIVVRS